MNFIFVLIFLFQFIFNLDCKSCGDNCYIKLFYNQIQGNVETRIKIGLNQIITMKIDFDSPFTWIQDSLTLNNSNSGYFSKSKITQNNFKKLQQGNILIQSQLSSDLFDFDSSLSPVNLNFSLVKSFSEKLQIHQNGYIGLSPVIGQDSDINLLDMLKNKGLFQRKIMGICLGCYHTYLTYSKLMIGNFDNQIVKNESSFNFCDSDKKIKGWNCYLKSLNINGNIYEIGKSVEFSLGFNQLSLPYQEYQKIRNQLFNDRLMSDSCQYYLDDRFHCSCTSLGREAYHNITFNFNENLKLILDYNDYTLIDQTRRVPNTNCVINFKINWEDKWIIGLDVLRNYYILADYDNDKIGFYEIRNLNLVNPPYAMIITVLIGCVIILIFVVLVAIAKRNRLMSRNTSNRESSQQLIN